jgi:acylphosphatase
MHRMQRRTYYFSGHVQGVGFRYTTEDLAAGYDVRGYVRNLPDGRVELVMEGEAAEMDKVIDALQERMGQFIRNTTVDAAPATGEFNDFTVRH